MVLITGVSDLTARSLLFKFIEEGIPVRALDFFKPKNIPTNIDFITTDLLDIAALTKACKDVTTVYHFMDMKYSLKKKRYFMRKVNIEGSINLLNCAVKLGAKQFNYISSYSVYGFAKQALNPDSPKKPLTVYGKDKLKAETILKTLSSKLKINFTVFRPAQVVHKNTSNSLQLMILYLALRSGEGSLLHLGNINSKFQLLSCEDAVRAYFSAYDKDNIAGKVFNLGCDNVISQLDLFSKCAKELGLNINIIKLSKFKAKLFSMLCFLFKANYFTKEHLAFLFGNCVLNCDMAKSDLNWTPTYSNLDIILAVAKTYFTKQ
jgi:nucleoside-diphosphate-sugar epimerase